MRSTILQNNHVSRSCRHAGADTRLQELSDFPTQTCAVNAVSENILCQSGLTSIFAPALPEYCLMDIRKKCSAVCCCSRLMLLFRFLVRLAVFAQELSYMTPKLFISRPSFTIKRRVDDLICALDQIINVMTPQVFEVKLRGCLRICNYSGLAEFGVDEVF